MSTDLATPTGGGSPFAQPVPAERVAADAATAERNAQVDRVEAPRPDLAEARRRADQSPQERFAEARGEQPDRRFDRKLSEAAYNKLTYAERVEYSARQTQLASDAAERERTGAQQGDEPKPDEAKHKFGDIELTETQIRSLQEIQAREDSKKLTLPDAPDKYEVRTSKDFQPPQGVEFALSPNDPQTTLLRNWAHRNGVPQAELDQLVDIYAGSVVGNEERVRSARDAEIGKLGATAGPRIDAIDRFFRAAYGEADAKIRMARIFTADDVRIAERELARAGGTASGSFSHSSRGHDDGEPRMSNEQYAKMSYSEKVSYAKQFQQPGQQPNGNGGRRR